MLLDTKFEIIVKMSVETDKIVCDSYIFSLVQRSLDLNFHYVKCLLFSLKQ